MAVAIVDENGKIVPSNSASSLASESVGKKGNTLDKDAFLGLLVAQMKYQDPLEPTSNTEFISQYAQFSSLEQMQNMSGTLELSRASSLVGKTVSVKTLDSLGQETILQGKVDYVQYENGKAYVVIGNGTYSLDDVIAVADQAYLDAFDKAYIFVMEMKKLPSYENLSLDDKEKIDELEETYNKMSAYEQSFIAKDMVTQLEKYVERIQELVDDLIGDFTSAMDDLPKIEKLKAEDKETIDNLNKMYKEMSEYKKGLVDESYITKLEEYTKKIQELVGDGSSEGE